MWRRAALDVDDARDRALRHGALAAVGSGAASLLGFASNWLRIAQLVEIVRCAAFPLMGYLLAILYVAFPFVLAAGLLPGGMGRLVTYFALVASVKAWPLAWAVVDQVYGYLLPALAAPGSGGERWQPDHRPSRPPRSTSSRAS